MVMEKIEMLANLLDEKLVIRPARMEDLEAVVAMTNLAAQDLIGVEDKFKAEDVRREWTTPGFNLETDTRVVTAPDGSVAGYYEVWDVDEPHVIVYVWGRVHPGYTGMGIGSTLLEWAESRACQAVPKAPKGTRVAMWISALSMNKEAEHLFQDRGFELIRHSLRMVIDLDRPPLEAAWPEGIRVRTLRAGEEERAVLQAVRESFQDHWGYVEHPFEEEYQRWMHSLRDNEDFDPSLWFLAVDGDRIAGMSLCWPKGHDDADMGWVGTLGVRRPWRRQGIALALLQHSFGEFYRRGKPRTGLGVDAESLTGATRLYRKAGMRPDAERQFSIFEKTLRAGRDISTQSVGE